MMSMISQVTQKKKVNQNQLTKTKAFNQLFTLNELEILLEPMMRFRVRGVTQQDMLKIVQIEPMKGRLLLEDEITPGCIQHIISNLLRYGKESKEVCDKMCRALCKVYMDDSSSRKTNKKQIIFGTFY